MDYYYKFTYSQQDFHIMFMLLNSNTTGATIGAGTAYLFRGLKFTPTS